MKWQLRQAAARRGVHRPEQLLTLVADAGFEVDALTMSELWSAHPSMVHLGDLEAICTALGCAVEEVIVHEVGARGAGPGLVARSAPNLVRPVRRSGRSLPP